MSRIIASICAFFMISSASALDLGSNSAETELLRDLARLTRRCVVRPFKRDLQGNRVYLPLRSVCEELTVDAKGAQVQHEGRFLRAFLSESEDSDGGDLAHLFVIDAKGEVLAAHRNVVAFDDVLVALAGGFNDFQLVRESGTTY